MPLIEVQFYHKSDSTSALDLIKHADAWFFDTTKGHAISYLNDGVTIKHFIQGDVNNNIINPLGNVNIISGSYIGLASNKGRFVFTDGLTATDTISIQNANFQTTGVITASGGNSSNWNNAYASTVGNIFLRTDGSLALIGNLQTNPTVSLSYAYANAGTNVSILTPTFFESGEIELFGTLTYPGGWYNFSRRIHYQSSDFYNGIRLVEYAVDNGTGGQTVVVDVDGGNGTIRMSCDSAPGTDWEVSIQTRITRFLVP